MFRWSTGSFIPSKSLISDILNFVGRGKYRTPIVNGDSVYCTRAPIVTGARPFMASFMWPSSCWMPLKCCSQDCAPFFRLAGDWIIAFIIPVLRIPIVAITSGSIGVVPPSPAIFSSTVNVYLGVDVSLFLLRIGITAFPGLLCLLWALRLSGEFHQLL